ncbi:MAG: sulfotransferase family 2 domain-containing protein, partial [Syntrophobacteraceae bacterium]
EAMLNASNDLAAVLVKIVDSEEFREKYTRLRSARGAVPAGKRPIKSKPESVITRNVFESQKDLGEGCLVFLHIPKTAGTSLYKMFGSSFGEEVIFRHHQDGLIDKARKEDLSKYFVFMGHMDYDAISYIPKSPISLCTFVRDPVERLLSLYYYLRAHEPSHPNYKMDWRMEQANELDIEEFFENDRVRLCPDFANNITWTIMGNRWMKTSPGLKLCVEKAGTAPSVSQIRADIRTRLKEFCFIGLQEDFSKSIELLFQTIKRKPPESIRNVNTFESLFAQKHFKKVLVKKPITPRLNSAFSDLVQLDRITYEESKNFYSECLSGIESSCMSLCKS